MKTVSSTEFRSHASALLSEVENGEVVVIERHGKPVAEIGPVSDAAQRSPSWKRPGPRLAVRGGGLAAAIIKERKRERVL